MMRNGFWVSLSFIVAVLSVSSISYAQPKSIGCGLSLCELSVNYRHSSGKGFYDMDAGLDMKNVIMGKNEYPGAFARLVYDFILTEKSFSDGEKFSLFCGPGFTFGYLRDMESSYGFTAGLCGKIGFDYTFNVPVSLSVSLNPTIAMAMKKEDGVPKLDIYRSGLINSVIPAIGIRYIF